MYRGGNAALALVKLSSFDREASGNRSKCCVVVVIMSEVAGGWRTGDGVMSLASCGAVGTKVQQLLNIDVLLILDIYNDITDESVKGRVCTNPSGWNCWITNLFSTLKAKTIFYCGYRRATELSKYIYTTFCEFTVCSEM